MKKANSLGEIATEIGLDCMKESQKRKEQNQNKEIQDLCHHGNAEVIPNSSLESRNTKSFVEKHFLCSDHGDGGGGEGEEGACWGGAEEGHLPSGDDQDCNKEDCDEEGRDSW